MKQEVIAVGRTVEAALSNGAAELGVETERVTYEVLEQPKKGFLGFGEAPAKVRVTYTPGPEDSALAFVKTLLSNMGLEAEAELSRELTSAGDRLIRVSGESAGVLIGHHGDTLDALQCLVNLVANRREEEEGASKYTKISVDIENYRVKREDTLRRLARNMAARVKKYRKNITLEPMNPYERRIIHSEIQNVEGVSTTSIGAENNRRIIIYLEENGKPMARRLGPRPAGAAAGAAGEARPPRPAGDRRGPKPETEAKPEDDVSAELPDDAADDIPEDTAEPTIEKSFGE